jgi:DNA-directed RNA polymerase specialized sigma24 family protein
LATRRIRLLAQWGEEAPELVNIDWPRVITLLISAICKRFPPATPNSILGRSGQTAADFASAAIFELLKRPQWSEEIELTDMNVFKLLRTIAYHDILDSAFRRKNGKRVAVRTEPLALCGTIADPCASAEEVLLQREGSSMLRKLEEDLRSRPDSHARFSDYLDLLTTDCNLKRAAIADILGITRGEVDKMHKRLRRRIAGIAPEMTRRCRLRTAGGRRG